MNNKKINTFLPPAIVTITLGFFLWFKFTHLYFRFGDGNAYLYMAKMMLGGQLPYRDFFLADPPFLVLFLAPFKLLFGSHLILFQTLPVVLETATALLLYAILKKWQNPLALLAPLLYLFSFTVLSTSDYLTGVQLTVFLMALGMFLWEKDFPLGSGIFWSFAVLTKLYALPFFAGFILYLLLSKIPLKKIFRLVYGSLAGGLVIMGPFALVAFSKLWEYIVVHQLHRPEGLDKWYVWKFFLIREWPLLALGLSGLILSLAQKTKRAIILPFTLGAIFFLAFKDLYYLYFDSLLPFLALSAVLALSWLWQKFRYGKQITLALLAGYAMFAISTFMVYLDGYNATDYFSSVKQVAATVKSLPENFDLYGSHEVAPLMALMSGRKLFGNYIDTNTQAFASGGQDLEEASIGAVRQGVYLLGRVTDLPQYGVMDFGMDGYFSKNMFMNFCKTVAKIPNPSSDPSSYIGVYRCKVE